jgi:hypothetical protein
VSDNDNNEASWLTLTEAAQRSGLPRETVRSRARRGLIPSRKGNRGELLVQLTAVIAAPDRGTTAVDTTVIADPDRGQTTVITDLTAEVAELRERLATVTAELAAARTVAAAEVAAKAEMIDELRRQMDRERTRADRLEAELRRPWWRKLLG